MPEQQKPEQPILGQQKPDQKKLGLVLTGGGARAAYQVGVLKAIAELLPSRARNPFHIISGTSAGALNAVTLAVNARHFRKGVKYLDNIWRNFQVHNIYRSDPLGVLRNSIFWVGGLILNVLGINKLNRVSLLDNTPLAQMLDQVLPCEKIQDSIDAGLLHALSITASGYGSGQSVNFYQSIEGVHPWKRARRMGIAAKIEHKHLLASSAIPFIFPAVQINREYFGDGSMRQIAPISPALHLGATRILVIGTAHAAPPQPDRPQMDDYPSLARIAGHAMDSIFLDSLEMDIERLQRINNTVSLVSDEIRQQMRLNKIEVLVILPSQPIEKIASRYATQLPWPIRFLLRAIGATRKSGANLVSYLLFDKDFCRALISLGYHDAMEQKQEILNFLNNHQQVQVAETSAETTPQ